MSGDVYIKPMYIVKTKAQLCLKKPDNGTVCGIMITVITKIYRQEARCDDGKLFPAIDLER
jgi:hypothetical protein